jgi:drug/metabolite transporter (DMT)-like permease
MLWLALALLATLLLTLVNFGDKLLVERAIGSPFAMLGVLAWLNAIGALLLWAMAGFGALPATPALLMIAGGFLTPWGNAFYFHAAAREEMSRLILLLQMLPLTTLLMAAVFLAQVPTASQLAGFVIVLGGVVGLVLTQASSPQAAAAPVRGGRRGAFALMLAACLVWGGANTLQAGALAAPPSSMGALLLVTAYASFGYFLGGLAQFLLLPAVRQAFRPLLDPRQARAWAAAAGVEALFFAQRMAFFAAISIGAVGLVAVVGSTSVFLAVLLGWLFTSIAPGIFKEDLRPQTILRKLGWASVMFAGLVLIR